MKGRLLAPLAMVIAVAAGCTAHGNGKSPSDEGKSGDATANAAKCLHEVDGKGDLEITDSAVSILNPAAADGDYKATYAVEVTNHSKSSTAMVAGLAVELVDGKGKTVATSEKHGAAKDSGAVEYVAPGDKAYIAGAFEDGFRERPMDMKIEFPHSVKVGVTQKATYWWPQKDVKYPPKLKVSNVEAKGTSQGGVSVRFDVDNKYDKAFQNVGAVVVLRDHKGKLIGGQYSGLVSLNDVEPLDVPRGRSVATLGQAFPNGLPPSTDTSNIEVRLINSPEWTKVDAGCNFMFDS